jgi:hypothetical protein
MFAQARKLSDGREPAVEMPRGLIARTKDPQMHASRRASRGQIQPVMAVALGVVAVVALAAAVLASRPSAPAAAPTAVPSVAPSHVPSAPPPSAAPTVSPTAAPSGGPLTVDLANGSGHDVAIQVHDETGTLGEAVSGTPGDGMSVRWNDSIVTQVDADTIRVTWVGLPGDDVADLNIASRNGGLALTIVQPGPVPYSDAMGEDRVLELSFDGPVSADDVSVTVLDRTAD